MTGPQYFKTSDTVIILNKAAYFMAPTFKYFKPFLHYKTKSEEINLPHY